ncbi:MAG: T9SS type B sorting domain-containing protein [Paludibacteraceae bacterium]|nr:T9SS type B sorting domain-containing protein [Paludibacteraceae bacterium]
MVKKIIFTFIIVFVVCSSMLADRTIHACYGQPLSVTAVNEGVSYQWNYIGVHGSNNRTIEFEGIDAMVGDKSLKCVVTKQGGAQVTETIQVIADVHLGDDVPKDYALCAGDGPYYMTVEIAPTPNDYRQYPDKYYFNPTFALKKNGELMPGEVYFDGKIASYDDIYINPQIGALDVYVMETNNGECRTTSTFNIESVCCPDTIDVLHVTCQSDERYEITTDTEGVLYKWSTGGNSREISVDVSKTGSKEYKCDITIQSPDGVCSRTEIHTVTVISNITKKINDKVCEGQSYSKYGFSIETDETIGQTIIERQHKEQSVATGCDSITTLTLAVCPNDSVTIEDRALLGESYNKNGFTVSKEETQNVGIITKTNKGKTKVCGCDSVTTLKLTVYEVKDIKPMVYFTPNDDGINDLWLIENIETHPNAYIQIYDRFDKLLLTVKASEFKGWDGIYNGHDMPMTDYWYVIISEDMNKKVSGHFTLKR